jgi:hypothetical protein
MPQKGIGVRSGFTGKLCLLMLWLAMLVVFSGCSEKNDTNETLIHEALSRIGLDIEAIALPKSKPAGSTKARLTKVKELMRSPPRAIILGSQLKQTEYSGSRSQYLSLLLSTLDIQQGDWEPEPPADGSVDAVWASMVEAAQDDSSQSEVPSALRDQLTVNDGLLPILAAIAQLRQAWNINGGQPTSRELKRIDSHLRQSVSYDGNNIEALQLSLQTYHQIGGRTNIDALSLAVLRLFHILENMLPQLAATELSGQILEWNTPLGLVRIAGKEDHSHRGNFLLLIDTGGNDHYEKTESTLSPGNISVVIDLEGNDKVSWKGSPGPGSGVFGMGIWWDLAGDDIYMGGNWGLGSALFGSAVFWDEAGDDVYMGGARVQGTGQYGVGFFVDSGGNDRYSADLASQGFGGSGGVGVMVDLAGDDQYSCGDRFPDTFERRVERHAEKRYFSFCQGYSFGLVPIASGGIGILLDRIGDDSYKSDIFAQGGGNFFGLGMLIDGAGNDRYEAFEHAQGEGLHQAAGFLGDWAGNDIYLGYEHVQGVGMDQAFGMLYDEAGDDVYQAVQESQGTGLNFSGVGILIDSKGDDKYVAESSSQGNSILGPNTPASRSPIGILLDLDGQDSFTLSGNQAVDLKERVQNDFGILINR